MSKKNLEDRVNNLRYIKHTLTIVCINLYNKKNVEIRTFKDSNIPKHQDYTWSLFVFDDQYLQVRLVIEIR